MFFVSVLFTSQKPKKLTEPRVIYHVASGSGSIPYGLVIVDLLVFYLIILWKERRWRKC